MVHNVPTSSSSRIRDVMQPPLHAIKSREYHVVRFAGDSGDGMQIGGQHFTNAVGYFGYDLATLQDFPAEIRAPAGTTYGVSAFQVQFGGQRVQSPGDRPDVLVALNPAALKVSLPLLEPGALIIVDDSTFNARQLKKAGFQSNPLEDNTLAGFDVYPIDITGQTVETLALFDLKRSQAVRCRNFWVLGFLLWTFDLPRYPLTEWVKEKFKATPNVQQANLAAINAGHAFGEVSEAAHVFQRQIVKERPLEAAEYRTIRGAEATALGLSAVSILANMDVLLCSYPITPSSGILHEIAKAGDPRVGFFQAEDEIASCCAAIGASYAGTFGVTSSSGPGLALKSESMSLGIASELPLLVIDSQRAGPSTGMPTKTEQSDLLQAVHGRNGDTPLPVVAAQSPADCFQAVIDASRIALRHMTPVVLLIDAYLANSAEFTRIPEIDQVPPIETAAALADALPAQADHEAIFTRDAQTLARPWPIPGKHQLMYRIGGLENNLHTGHISYDPDNHQAKANLRHEKMQRVASFLPQASLAQGDADAKLLVLGWGSSYGIIYEAVQASIKAGHSVAQAHLRFMYPFAPSLGDLLAPFEKILIPEINLGQLASLLRSELPGVAERVQQYNKVTGLPFKVQEIFEAIEAASQDG